MTIVNYDDESDQCNLQFNISPYFYENILFP